MSRTTLHIDNLVLSEANDIIIPSTGETAIDISQASCIKKDNIAIGGDINIIKSQQDGVFLSYYLNYIKTDIARMAQGISVIHLYSNQLKNLKVNLPSIKEQKKISNLLLLLNKKIELMEKISDRYDILKNYFLKNMFSNLNLNEPKIRYSEFDTPLNIYSIKDILKESKIKSEDNLQKRISVKLHLKVVTRREIKSVEKEGATTQYIRKKRTIYIRKTKFT